MKNAAYWDERMKILEQSRYDGDVQSYHEIERIYRKQMAEMQKEINAWYKRFAENNEMSLADANKLLGAKELEELKWNVEDYIKYGEENALDPKWMKQLENASARYHISRLEALQMQIQQRAESVMAAEQDVVDQRVRDVYSDTFYHTAFELQRGIGVGWDLERLDQRRIDTVIQKPWAVDGKNFSERIWEQRDKLVNTLHQELTQSIIRGEDPERAVGALAERMEVSKSNARRLIMTESAAMASRSQQDCYNELDVEKYKIVATLDNLTCDVCGGLDGQVFKMSEYAVGTTAPPFHPNCRTVTVPYFADDKSAKRAARGADGKTYLVPADTKYNEWKKAFVDGEEKPFKVDPDWKPKEPEPKPEPIELKYKFVEAKTIEEAQEYAKQFVGGGYAPHFKNDVNFKGISVEHANEINRALTDAFNRFDMPKLNGITTVSPTSAIGKKAFKDGADAVFSYSPVEGGIYINKEIVKNAKSFETYVKRSEDAWQTVIDNIDKLKGADKEKALIYKNAGRDLVDGKTIKGMFTHEIGHHVQWQMLKPNEINDIGSRKSQFAPKISGYANASQGEYFAESFAAYAKGERSNLDPEFVKLMDSKKKVLDAAKPSNDTKRKPVPENASDVRQALISAKVDKLSYKEHEKPLTTNKIIDRISGGDMTKGSCASVAFAYVGNKAGFDVRDFRGGTSHDIFWLKGNIIKISKLNGVESFHERDTNDFKAIRRLFQNMKEDKEYYLATGSHAAIVRKVYDDVVNFHFEYLELQSPNDNGFKRLNDTVLKKRFKCQKSYTTIGIKLEMTSTLIDIESLGENAEFQALLEYLNTEEDKQMKGESGNVK